VADLVAAALVPGMPHMLAADPAPSWARLGDAVRRTGDRMRAAGVRTVVMMSTQWFTVLGHQVQTDPHLRGTHCDENWYRFDYGRQSFDLTMDTELALAWADAIDERGLQARRTRDEGFPIDNGTITAMNLLDPGHGFELALVSCNLYAGVDAMRTLGEAAAATAGRLDRRIGVVAVSGLSSGLIQRWITPDEDRVAEENRAWDRRMLDLVVDRKHDDVLALREEYARAAQVDSQLRVYPFLAGAGAGDLQVCELVEYGPLWGTGAAVVNWQ
jgi:2-aminophenol/2-amino-5-chlorophenol 1,6-dioxygenase subunit alpha